jgi:hypothetical protein
MIYVLVRAWGECENYPMLSTCGYVIQAVWWVLLLVTELCLLVAKLHKPKGFGGTKPLLRYVWKVGSYGVREAHQMSKCGVNLVMTQCHIMTMSWVVRGLSYHDTGQVREVNDREVAHRYHWQYYSQGISRLAQSRPNIHPTSKGSSLSQRWDKYLSSCQCTQGATCAK